MRPIIPCLGQMGFPQMNKFCMKEGVSFFPLDRTAFLKNSRRMIEVSFLSVVEKRTPGTVKR